MPRKKKIAEMEQLDGKLHEEPQVTTNVRKPRTLDEIMGIESISKYKISDTNEYETYIRDLNVTDLARECERVGLVPTHDIYRMRKNLVSEHSRYFNTRMGGQARTTPNITDPAVLKILSEGR